MNIVETQDKFLDGEVKSFFLSKTINVFVNKPLFSSLLAKSQTAQSSLTVFHLHPNCIVPPECRQHLA